MTDFTVLDPSCTKSKDDTYQTVAHKQAAPASPDNNRAQDKRVSRLGTSPLGGLIAEFALPAITGMIVSGAYAVIDSVFLGQAMGSLGLSAATVAAPFMILIVAFGVLIGNGGGV